MVGCGFCRTARDADGGVRWRRKWANAGIEGALQFYEIIAESRGRSVARLAVLFHGMADDGSTSSGGAAEFSSVHRARRFDRESRER